MGQISSCHGGGASSGDLEIDDSVPESQTLPIPYSQAKDQILPGDLVFFAGGDFVSGMIRFIQGRIGGKVNKHNIPSGTFSHVGMIVTPNILDHPKVLPGKIYVWESTMSGRLGSGVPNVDGESFLGVQLRNFEDLVPKYLADGKKTKIAIAHLQNNPFLVSKRRSKVIAKMKFTEVFHRYNGAKYDSNMLSLAGSGLACIRPIRKIAEEVLSTESWLFCSELIAAAYRDLGILPEDIDPKNTLPMDFLGYDTDEKGRLPIVIETPIIYIKEDEEENK